jgi:site-specific recombinase
MGIFQRGRIHFHQDRNSYLERGTSGGLNVVVDGVAVLVTAAAPLASASQAAVTVTSVTAIATTVFSAAFTGMWAFSSSTVAKTFQPRINQLRVDVAAMNVLLTQIRTALITNKTIKGEA